MQGIKLSRDDNIMLEIFVRCDRGSWESGAHREGIWKKERQRI